MQTVLIEEYIPHGYENRISRPDLQMRTGFSDRLNRQLIEQARERRVLIVSADGGYFIPAEGDEVHVRGYIQREKNRFKTMSHKLKLLKRDFPDRSEMSGQMSLFEEKSTNAK